MFHRASRRQRHDEHQLPASGRHPRHMVDPVDRPIPVGADSDGDLLRCPEGAVRLVVVARLMRDPGQEVEGCLALEGLGWDRAEEPARRLLDGVLRTVGRRLGPLGAEQHLRRASTQSAACFELEPEVFHAVAFEPFARAGEATGLRRDYLVLCALALAAEMLRLQF
jgi:hypothetical protein